MRSVVAVTLSAILLLALVGCERWALDRQMEELCKKDGGVKVYDTVALPARYFEHDGRLRMSQSMPYGTKSNGEDARFERVGDDEYRVVSKKIYLVGKDADPTKGEGNLARRHTAVYRWSDKHLLGESVEYWRGGGDGFTFGFQPSGNVCPRPLVDIVQSVFLKGK